jgi:hypothetical protein
MLAETAKIIPLLTTADFNNGTDTDSFKMLGDSATIIFTFGAVTGNAVLKVYSGATEGAKTSALPFRYAYGGAAIGSDSSDVLTDWGSATASSGLTLTGTTYTTRMAVVHVDASAMDTANSEEWLTLNISNAASAGIVHVVAVLENPRISGNQSTTLL